MWNEDDHESEEAEKDRKLHRWTTATECAAQVIAAVAKDRGWDADNIALYTRRVRDELLSD